jgi:hypothetical protein
MQTVLHRGRDSGGFACSDDGDEPRASRSDAQAVGFGLQPNPDVLAQIQRLLLLQRVPGQPLHKYYRTPLSPFVVVIVIIITDWLTTLWAGRAAVIEVSSLHDDVVTKEEFKYSLEVEVRPTLFETPGHQVPRSLYLEGADRCAGVVFPGNRPTVDRGGAQRQVPRRGHLRQRAQVRSDSLPVLAVSLAPETTREIVAVLGVVFF